MLIYALVFSKDALKISEYYLQAKIRFRNAKAGANKVKMSEIHEYTCLK